MIDVKYQWERDRQSKRVEMALAAKVANKSKAQHIKRLQKKKQMNH